MKLPPRVAEAFDYQARSCAALGSPFMDRLMTLCAEEDWPDGALFHRISTWEGDLGPRVQSVPLRLAGALHALKLRGHSGLKAVYPPQAVSSDVLWQAVGGVLLSEADFIDTFIDNPPQTNEVRRSVVLVALGHLLADRFDMPIRTSELGASGGLNLHWDAYGLDVAGSRYGAAEPALTLTPDWPGPALPDRPARVVERGGVDIRPLDPTQTEDALRLQAYLWPDQPERMALTRAAMAAATTRVDRADAIDWLKPRLAHRPGHLHLIYSTIAWQYFPSERQAEGRAAISAAGEAATDASPLAWFGMENDGGERGAALTLRLWPGDLTFDLGRADFHGRWVEWRAP